MKQNNNIKISYLCNEPFWKFTKTNNSEYCKTCRHSLYDFTALNEVETIQFLQNSDGKTCGIFYENQFLIDNETKKGPSLIALLLTGSLTVAINNNVNAEYLPLTTLVTEQSNEFNIKKPKHVERTNHSKQLAANKNKVSRMPKNIYKKEQPLKIGNLNIYMDLKFPFIHIKKRIRRGMVYISPQF